MTFADSVLHLVRAGARIDSWAGLDAADSDEGLAIVPVEDIAAAPTGVDEESADPSITADTLLAGAVPETDQVAREYEPGLADLEAAVGLVSTGLARRVVLSGFQSWPGLLWRAYQLADTAGVLILPAVVRPGGRVDIVITRETATNG